MKPGEIYGLNRPGNIHHAHDVKVVREHSRMTVIVHCVKKGCARATFGVDPGDLIAPEPDDFKVGDCVVLNSPTTSWGHLNGYIAVVEEIDREDRLTVRWMDLPAHVEPPVAGPWHHAHWMPHTPRTPLGARTRELVVRIPLTSSEDDPTTVPEIIDRLAETWTDCTWIVTEHST